MAGLLVGGLRFVDSRVPPGKDNLRTASDAASRTIHTLELFPFDGMHVQANFHHRGPMPWNDHTPEADFDIRTGDKGYFIDFSLEDPPPKAADEFRIILTGGSGAQGWGATRNDRMFYAVLERELNARLAGRGIRVRVINLAMGGSFLYQNFVSLNQWAHPLEPDLILAYAGRNDFFVPIYHERGTDRFLYAKDLGAFAYASRGSEHPPGMAWLFRLMPNTMRRTSLGLGVKIAFGWEYFQKLSREGYLAARGLRADSFEQTIEGTVMPMVVRSLKSIKRDFEGVPVLLAWQPVRFEFDYLKGRFPPEVYDRMFESTRRAVAGYLDDRWYFVNLHRLGMEQPQLNFQTHLDDRAHAVVGKLLAGQIEAIMPALLEERARRLARGLPAGYGRELPSR
jgi:hypothetical protein